MKKYLVLITMLFCAATVVAQDRITAMIDNIRYVTEVPYGSLEITGGNPDNAAFAYNSGCGDHLYWKIVNLRLRAVPQLISIIDDMSPSQAKLPSGDGYYRTGDAALMALKEIIHNLPVETLSGLKAEDFAAPYYFYEQGLKDKKKRTALKEALAKWYANNQKDIVFEKSQAYGNCECFGKHPVGGHYILKE